MNEPSRILGRGAVHGLTGLMGQLLLSGVLLWMTTGGAVSAAAGHLLWASFAGAVIWLHTALLFMFLKFEASGVKETGGEETGKGEGGESKIRQTVTLFFYRLNKRRLLIFQRVLTPAMEIGVAALLFRSILLWFQRGLWAPAAVEANWLLLIALYSVLTLALVVFSLYVGALMKVKTWHLLKSGRNYTNYICLMVIGLLLNACFSHFGIQRAQIVTVGLFTALNTLLGAEILLSMILRFFAPRRPGMRPRTAFDFYLLEGMSHPGRIGRTFSLMLESIFGFDIARTSFGKIARALVFPAMAISAIILLGISAVVIVEPGEQGALLNFGHLHETPLEAGLHVTLPWPLATVRRYRVDAVKSVHVGSHRPRQAGGEVYQEGVPILWTNMHGITVDELLICSSPNDMVTAAGQKSVGTSDQKAPSVSLAAADVRIQYVIHDLIAYVRAAANPEAFLENLAESQASRFIYRYDIDDLFCEGRLALIDDLRSAVQEGCDRHALGVEIVHVAITAVHPPMDVASAFEETVAATQERETRIQHAQQSAIRSQVETTGSKEVFAELASLEDATESSRSGDSGKMDELLARCGGEISGILAEAQAYRFSRENVEKGNTERFGEQLSAYEASPLNYRYDSYFSVLESGLKTARKVVISENADEVILRMGTEGGDAFGYQIDDEDVMTRRYREQR